VLAAAGRVVANRSDHMAPEQAQGHGIDRRVDVWAAGVVAWEALTGARLYEGGNDAATLLKIVRECDSLSITAEEHAMGRAREVDEWFERYENPMKAVVMRMRDIILAVDPRVGECIKWQAPTFTFEGNIASFFPKSKRHASLMFHRGAEIPGRHPILEGGGATGRFVKIASVEEANQRAKDLSAVIRAWIDMMAAATPKPRAAKARTGTPPGRKRVLKKAARKSAAKGK